jgi:hypothetical protein
MIPVIYHGSLTSEHGRGKLIGSHGTRYILESINGNEMINVHRESFTILDDDLDNQKLELKFQLA